MRFLLLMICFSFLSGCKVTIDESTPPPLKLTYNSSSVNLDSGDILRLSPRLLQKGRGQSFTCQMTDSQPTWITINSETCELTITAIKAGQWGPYNIIASNDDESSETTLYVNVTLPDPNDFTPPAVAPSVTNHFMIATLKADSHYFAAFNSTHLLFMDASNPYAPHVLHSMALGPLGIGAPQAITSIGHFIYIVTNTGYVASFDWTQRSTPVFVSSFLVLNGGQNYDLADDGQSTLFIANTTNQRFSVIDVSNPASLQLEYNFDTLLSLGAGVTYANGYVYVAAYGGKVFTFKKVNGAWTSLSTVDTSFTQIHRPFANGKYLLVPRYNDKFLDVFSLEDPSTPLLVDTINTSGNINVYSRPLIHDDQIYATNAEAPARIDIYDINKTTHDTTLAYSWSPRLASTDPCGDIMSIGLFRNGSFLYLIGTEVLAGGNRHIMTQSLPLPSP